MVKRKERTQNTGRQDRGSSKGKGRSGGKSFEEEIFSSAESTLIDYLKGLGTTLPSSPVRKEDDPMFRLLQEFALKWKKGVGR
ncbi:MAG: hypothetical protein ACTSW1_01410 [Candidatus Hodarchaeales archaeon]